MTHFTPADRKLLSDIKTQLDRIERAAKKQNRKVNEEMDELIARAKKNEDAEDAAAVLLGDLKKRLDAAGTDPAKLKQLSDDLGTHGDALAAAIVANTPAA